MILSALVTTEANKTLRILRREEHTRTERHHKLHGDESHQKREALLNSRALELNITREHLDDLLSKPDEYHAFLRSRQPQHGEVVINQPEPLNPHLKRRQKKSQSGTVFDTTNWDPLFDRKKRGG